MAAEDNGESGGEVRKEIEKNGIKKTERMKKPALDFDSTGEYNIYKYRKPCKRFISNITMM